MKTNQEREIKGVVQLLFRTFGPIEATRIIRLLHPGEIRDYTAERHRLLSKLDPKDIVKSIQLREAKKRIRKVTRRKRIAG